MTKTLHSWHLSIAHADMLSDCSKEHMLLFPVFHAYNSHTLQENASANPKLIIV